MVNIPLFIGFHTSQVVQDFSHQQYHCIFLDDFFLQNLGRFKFMLETRFTSVVKTRENVWVFLTLPVSGPSFWSNYSDLTRPGPPNGGEK